jgi:hypothetical protein
LPRPRPAELASAPVASKEKTLTPIQINDWAAHLRSGSFAILAAIRGAHCTSHAFGFSGGSPHSHLPVCEL